MDQVDEHEHDFSASEWPFAEPTMQWRSRLARSSVRVSLYCALATTSTETGKCFVARPPM
jgi:hypothetical protein